MNIDGSGVTRLTSDPAHELQPAWSPDGTKIAFNGSRDREVRHLRHERGRHGSDKRHHNDGA